LICNTETTADDIDRFVLGLLTVPHLCCSVLQPDQLSIPLQQRFLTILNKWKLGEKKFLKKVDINSEYQFFVVSVEGRNSLLLSSCHNIIKDMPLSPKLSEWLCNEVSRKYPVYVYTSKDPGVGKTRLINENNNGTKRKTLTLCGDVHSSLFQTIHRKGEEQLPISIRIGASVSGNWIMLLFQYLLFDFVISREGDIITRNYNTYIECYVDKLQSFLCLLNVFYVSLPLEIVELDSCPKLTIKPCREQQYRKEIPGVLLILQAYDKKTVNLQILKNALAGNYRSHYQLNLMEKKLIVESIDLDKFPYSLSKMIILHLYNWYNHIAKNVIKTDIYEMLTSVHETALDMIHCYLKKKDPETSPFMDLISLVDPKNKILEYVNYKIGDFYMSSKLAEILLSIQSRIKISQPLVLEGHTGCGKTTLIKFLCQLDKMNLVHLRIHGGWTNEIIEEKLTDTLNEIKKYHSWNRKKSLLFLDEVNTSPAVDLIKDFICDQRIKGIHISETLGKDFQDKITFVAAINPYMKRSSKEIKRFQHMGLRIMTNSGLTDLLYRVNPLPPTLQHFVYPFGDMSDDIENLCITKILTGLPDKLVAATTIAHSFMKTHESDCKFVSFRDVNHCREVYQFIQKFFSTTPEWAVSVSVAVSYITKLSDRKPLYTKLAENGFLNVKKHYKEFISVVVKETTKPSEVSMNKALAENILMMVLAIELSIPLFIVGPPGSSKSLARLVVRNSMVGSESTSPFFKRLKIASFLVLQCSPHTTTEDLQNHFNKAQNNVVLLEEVGLAEMSPSMPLKLLHQKFDEEIEKNTRKPFIAMSNWLLDPSKMSRALFVTRSLPKTKELKNTAIELIKDFRLKPIVEALSVAFEKVLYLMENKPEFPEGAFYALRDFYNCVNRLNASEVINNDTLLEAIQRNFSGLPKPAQNEVNKIFTESFIAYQFYPKFTDVKYFQLISSAFNQSVTANRSRYPLVISHSPIGILSLLKSKEIITSDTVILCGTGFSNDSGVNYMREVIKPIKECISSGKKLVLLELNEVYETLYDMLNKFHIIDKDIGCHVEISVGSGFVIKVKVHDEFQLMVLSTTKDAYNHFPPPLLNRFEKHGLKRMG